MSVSAMCLEAKLTLFCAVAPLARLGAVGLGDYAREHIISDAGPASG